MAADGKNQEAKDQEIKKDLLSWMSDPFVYQREGRHDPFEPFLPQKLLPIDVPAEELTGMRRFEPGQLTLVSIVFTEKEALAMVQDSSGKGYILKKGDKIGRSGVVSDIVPNEVIIQQQMLTATGEKRTQAVEMVLRKEGEN
ncbi:MAG: hypothetical protein M0017_01870 [Desulfobacteraceae bacterium]|nr:hypothetical protein [Desulfobacteraceae bacterium]